MSVELTVYTRLPEICEINRLAARLAEAGWEIRALNEYSGTAEVLPEGPLPKEGVVYGWKRAHRKGRRFSALFQPGLLIDAWSLPEEDLAACNISISLFDTPDDLHERDQWAGSPLPAEKLAVLQQAECRYELSAWAADTPLSNRFLCDIAWALAKETGGIVFDAERVHAEWAEEMASAQPASCRTEGPA